MVSPRAELTAAALAAGHRVEIRATGSSMRPLIPSGSRITVEPLQNQIARGDILLVRVDGLLVAHRVRSCAPLVLAGDSSTVIDRDPEVLGRVVAVEIGSVVMRIDRGWGKAWSRLCGELGPWVRRAERLRVEVRG